MGPKNFVCYIRYFVISVANKQYKTKEINSLGPEKFVCYTVEPHYNEVLGTMKITLLYRVSHSIRVKKTKKYKEVGPAELPCYKRVLLYPTSL